MKVFCSYHLQVRPLEWAVYHFLGLPSTIEARFPGCKIYILQNKSLSILETFEITDTSLLNQGHLSHLSLNEGIFSIFDTPFILECRWPLSSTRLWQRLMLNHLKFKWRGKDQLFPSPSSFSSTDFMSSLLLVEIMGTISGTTSPDSILSANRPCS